MSRIWIDFDNAPHVPFFRPLIRELESRGHSVTVTLRDYGYTAGLAEDADIPFRAIGTHPGGNLLRKVVSLGWRAFRLAAWARGRRFDLALSHGSRGLVVAARTLSIPSVTMFDYEHVSAGLFRKLSTALLLPEALRSVLKGPDVLYYPGYKEEVYLADIDKGLGSLSQLPIPEDHAVVVLRPPATAAHYHDDRSEGIFRAFLARMAQEDGVFTVIVPRTQGQGAEIRKILENPLKFHILEHPVDGPELLWRADVVVGAGGTMNREAALLGVPVYSIFTGADGAIDAELERKGLLKRVRRVEDVTDINVSTRERSDIGVQLERVQGRSQSLVSKVVDTILTIANGPG
jgi:uncharacterized protein